MNDPLATVTATHPHADFELARLLEATEAAANAAFVAARARLQPAVGATSLLLPGVHALFDGPGSPLTQTFGLGVIGDVEASDLERVEGFFLERGAEVQHEVAPYIPQQTLSLLTSRGYRPIEFSTVLVRPTATGPGPAPGIDVRTIRKGEEDLWARTAGEGWRSESDDVGTFVEALGRTVSRADGVHCFLAEIDREPVAAGLLRVQGAVALLSGASTIPAARRRGAQRALLDARLRFAARHGCSLAMMVAHPGSGSQRNAERQGFRVAYTRTKWLLSTP